jgi:hypothetical protein
MPSDLFLDAIWLRGRPDPEALPVLIRLLRVDRATGSIQQYAAAQALFTLGLPEGLEAMDQAVGEPPCGYQVIYAFNYASYWGMDPLQAAAMHKRFHLSHASGALDMAVAASVAPEGDRVFLDMVVSNRSGRERETSTLLSRSQKIIVVEDMRDGRLIAPMRSGGLFEDWYGEHEALPPEGKMDFQWTMRLYPANSPHLHVDRTQKLPDTHLTLDTGATDTPYVGLRAGEEYRFWVIWEPSAHREDFLEADRSVIPSENGSGGLRLFERVAAVSNPVKIPAIR